MNKRFFVTVWLLFSALYGYSQVAWNVKAGMNVSKITNYGVNDMKPGYQFGVGMDYFFTGHWGIQPSLMIISKGLKSNGDLYSGNIAEYLYHPPNASYSETVNRMYLEMPVMLAYRFNVSGTVKLVFNGGGYVSYGIGGKYRFHVTLFEGGSAEKTSGSSFDERTHRLDFGLGAGTALEYKNRYTVSLFAEWGLKDTFKPVYTQKNTVKLSNQTYGLNIGYKF